MDNHEEAPQVPRGEQKVHTSHPYLVRASLLVPHPPRNRSVRPGGLGSDISPRQPGATALPIPRLLWTTNCNRAIVVSLGGVVP